MMKKILAILLAAMMVFALAACDTGDDPNPSGSNNPGTSQGGENNNGGGNNNGSENNNGGNNNGGNNNGGSTAELPDGLKPYVGQYPFLADFVYPEGATVTEFDDSDYSDDKMVSITFESFDNSKLDAYLDKVNATKEDGYEFAAVLNSDGDPVMIIDFSSISYGRVRIDAFDYGTVSGSATLSEATINGYDLPAEALKYVGTFEKAYADTDKVFYIKANNITEGSFDELINYYASNGGALDTEYSTSSEKLYTFSWGKIIATRLGSKLSIEITLN